VLHQADQNFEEAARTLDLPGGTKMIEEYYRQMRKFGCYISAVVQQYDIIKDSPVRGAMIGNSNKLPIKAPVADVYRAVPDEEQIRLWWTRDATFKAQVGAIAEFGFGQSSMKMEVETVEPPPKMAWKALSGPPHWSGTKVFFELEGADSSTVLLKGYLENGKGTPNPDDVAFWS
jgi:hypothetical protein